jgi:hypothetical protein
MAHCSHEPSRALPEQVGVTPKSTGGGGRATVGDLQQISPKQSLSCVHVTAHVDAQRPLQQIGVPGIWSHSVDVVHALGHAWTAGFKHRPEALKWGSTACTVVQQISPLSALHCESVLHGAGHSSALVQMGRS